MRHVLRMCLVGIKKRQEISDSLVRQSRASLIAVAMLLILHSSACSQQKEEAPPPRSKKQEEYVRRAVYTGRVSTSMSPRTPKDFGRVLIVPPSVESAFKENRQGTLRLLLDIVRGGRPQDAILAMAFAFSLAKDVRIGPLFTDISPNDLDEVLDDTTQRDRFIKALEDLLKKEKCEPEKKK